MWKEVVSAGVDGRGEEASVGRSRAGVFEGAQVGVV